jgi:hypothetical protein
MTPVLKSQIPESPYIFWLLKDCPILTNSICHLLGVFQKSEVPDEWNHAWSGFGQPWFYSSGVLDFCDMDLFHTQMYVKRSLISVFIIWSVLRKHHARSSFLVMRSPGPPTLLRYGIGNITHGETNAGNDAKQ